MAELHIRGSKPLTRGDLDELRCCENHASIEFVAPCHSEAGLRVLYSRETGDIEIGCAECNARVAIILVAPAVLQ